MACGYISIIDTGIQLSHLTGKLLYYSQSEVLLIPHGTTMGIPRINDPIYKCEPTPGQLFTNSFGGPPDWVLSSEGDGCGPVEIKSWPAGLTTMDKGAGLPQRGGVHQTTHSGGVFDLRECEWPV